MFTQDSLFDSSKLLSTRVLPFIVKHVYKGAYRIRSDEYVLPTEGLTEGSNSGPFDLKPDPFTTRPQILYRLATSCGPDRTKSIILYIFFQFNHYFINHLTFRLFFIFIALCFLFLCFDNFLSFENMGRRESHLDHSPILLSNSFF